MFSCHQTDKLGMNARTFTGWVLLSAVACSLSCRKEELPQAATVEAPNALATVAGTPISREAFEAELKKRSRKGAVTDEQKLATLEALYGRKRFMPRRRQRGSTKIQRCRLASRS